MAAPEHKDISPDTTSAHEHVAQPETGQELERKFVTPPVPFPDEQLAALFDYDDMKQAYTLIDDQTGQEQRVRIKVNRSGSVKFEATAKGDGTDTRDERNWKISTEEFKEGSADGARVGNVVEKRRYKIKYEYPVEEDGQIVMEAVVIEYSRYHGALEGLSDAEVEFTSPDQMSQFIAPPWFGPEVTDDPRYKNKNLARYGIPEDYPYREEQEVA